MHACFHLFNTFTSVLLGISTKNMPLAQMLDTLQDYINRYVYFLFIIHLFCHLFLQNVEFSTIPYYHPPTLIL